MGKHMTLNERIAIQTELERNTPIKAIARKIGKAPRTVAREIKQRREKRDAKQYGRTNNRCVRRDRCPDWARCPGEGRCARFEEERCPKVLGAPFVCNGCPKLASCPLTRFVYNARRSDAAYRKTLSERREGPNIGAEELRWLDGLVSPGVIKGQSIHHAVLRQRERLPVSERTIYRYFRAGNLFTALRGDLRRACRLKPRKGKRKEHKLDTKCREGRTYERYRAYTEEHPAASVVQMDTVIGRIGGKCLLTLHFTSSCFMVARLLPDHTAKSVNDAIDEVARRLGPRRFRILLAVILLDLAATAAAVRRAGTRALPRLLLRPAEHQPEVPVRAQPRIHPHGPAEGDGLRRADAVGRGQDPLAREQLRAAGPGQPPPRRHLREALRQGRRGGAGDRPRGAAGDRAETLSAEAAGGTGEDPGRRCPIAT